jgi:predicted DNA-binding protein (MmcQ/YjbR family)
LAFKSNTNFWSPEIYFVGVNYKGLTNEERQNIKKIISKTNDNETCYPFDKIPEEFIKTYADIMYNYISFASDVKKFFVFLSTNEDIYESNKENITNIILDKNNGWMKKYLGERVYKF